MLRIIEVEVLVDIIVILDIFLDKKQLVVRCQGEIAGKELAGIVSGISTIIVMIGIIAGPPVFGYIIDKTASYQAGWQLLAILAAVAAVLLLFVREERRRI